MILYLVAEGENRFGRLLRGVEGISRKVLAEQLRQLEHDGILRRTDYRELPFRVEYALTPKGDTLRPLLAELYRWGHEQQLGLHTQAER